MPFPAGFAPPRIPLVSIATALAALIFAGCASNRSLENVAAAYRDRGEARLVTGGNPDGAISDFTRAIEYAPDDANGYAARGIAYMKKGETANARADFEQASSRDSSLGKALFPLLEPTRWTFVGTFSWGDVYRKDDAVERSADGRYVTVFLRSDWDVMRVEFDCAERKYRPADIYGTPYFGWDNVTEGSVVGVTSRALCR